MSRDVILELKRGFTQVGLGYGLMLAASFYY